MKNLRNIFKVKNFTVIGVLLALQMGVLGCILDTDPNHDWSFQSCDDEVDFRITTVPIPYKYSWKLFYLEGDDWELVNSDESQSNSYSASICPEKIAKLTVKAHHTVARDDYYEWSINEE